MIHNFNEKDCLTPWEPVETSNNFDKELHCEMSPEHVLYGKQVEAIACRMDNDDVLFSLLDHTKQYIVNQPFTLESLK